MECNVKRTLKSIKETLNKNNSILLCFNRSIVGNQEIGDNLTKTKVIEKNSLVLLINIKTLQRYYVTHEFTFLTQEGYKVLYYCVEITNQSLNHFLEGFNVLNKD